MKTLEILFLLFFVINLYSKEAKNTEPTKSQAVINPEYLNYLEEIENGTFKTHTKDGKPLGYRPSPLRIITEIPGQESKLKSIEAFPASYDLREKCYLTNVKDQGVFGACWTFGVIASIESSWIMNGLATASIDLSEENISTCHGFLWKKDDGGNYEMATAYLTKLKGPLSEADDPFSLTNTFCRVSNGNPVNYITESRYINRNEKEIKNAIMKYGAVAVGINMGDYLDYYNPKDFTYNYTGYNYADHAVCIVGWDDNKKVTGGPKSEKTLGNGAWIIKNSWGINDGNNGYFYVSYEDKCIARTAVYYPTTVEKSDFDTGGYFMYDDLGAIKAQGSGNLTDYGLIKFNSSSKRLINKVGTFILVAGTTVDIEIYGSKSNNTLTNLLGSEYGIFVNEAGYYTFDIEAIIEGDFYIKIKYQNPYVEYLIPVEIAVTGYANPNIESGVCWTSKNGTNWNACGNDIPDREFDVCIRAYSSLAKNINANFIADKREACKGTEITFINKSVGTIDSFYWGFGEDASPPNAHGNGPHTVNYSTPGKKDVSLTIYNNSDSSIIIKNDYINVTENIFVRFPDVTFESNLFGVHDALNLFDDYYVTTHINTPVELKASGADTYSWFPSTGLNSVTGATVTSTIDTSVKLILI